MKKRLRLDYWSVVTGIAIAFFLVFFLYPVSRVFVNSVYNFKTGDFSIEAFRKFFSRSYYTSTIFNSFKVTITATLITMITGSLMAYIM